MLQGWRLASPRSDRLRRFEVPSDSTFQRVLSALEAPALERRLAVWLDALDPHRQDGICIEGKTLRGSRDGDGHPLHLLSALTQGSLQFLGQGPVDHKTNEIRAVRPWLDPLDLAGRAVPLAALHPQPATARYLVFERDADYLFTLKDNQKQFKTPRCPPAARFFFPPQHTEPVSGAHGRIEWRDSALPPVSAGDFGFVAAAQVARVRRHRLSKKTGRIQTQTAYLVTSLWPTEATPAEVLAGHRAHWGIENGNHYRRAVTFDEDHCRIRHPGGAPVMATWRSLAISLYLCAVRREPKGTPESLRLWLRGNRQTMDATIGLLDWSG